MNLTEHFTEGEFLKTNRAFPNVLPDGFRSRLLRVAEKLEAARAILGVPIIISTNGGYRSPILNSDVRGSLTSAHMFALAADWTPAGMNRETAFRKLWADEHWMEDVDQLILERGCIHMGLSQSTARRWAMGESDSPALPSYPRVAVWPQLLPDEIPHKELA